MKEYHYVLTVCWTNTTGGESRSTYQGVYTPPKGATRDSELARMLKTMQGFDIPAGGSMPRDASQFSILCWTLEPNELEDA